MTTATMLSGNLTREPEIRYTREGLATTSLGIAVNKRRLDRDSGVWEEQTSYFDAVCFGELAENAALSFTKGMRVVVTGRLTQRSWSSDDGTKHTKVELTADDLGPSLRFATADVSRVARRSDEGESTDATSA